MTSAKTEEEEEEEEEVPLEPAVVRHVIVPAPSAASGARIAKRIVARRMVLL